MKNFYLLLFFSVCFNNTGLAQSVLELLPNDTIFWDVTSGVGFEGSREGKIVNQSDKTQTYFWIKEVYCSPEQWGFTVGDGVAHYTPDVDSSHIDITIEPGEKHTLMVEATSKGQPGGAQVNMKVYLRDKPGELLLTGTFIFNEGCRAVNIADNNFGEQITVYPNPTSSVIRLDLPEHLQIQGVQLFDISGQLKAKFSQEDALSKYEFDLSNLAPGSYFLELKLKTGEEIRKKVILAMR